MDQLNRRRKVMIGTPTYDGKIDVWYGHSLLSTSKIAWENNIDLYPIWVSYDALIQRARNDLIAMSLELDCDDLIFIDADIEWRPEWIFRLLDHPVDVVGGTYRKKGDLEQYVCKLLNIHTPKHPITGLIEVDGLGTGFLRFSRRAIEALWNNTEPYEEKGQNKIRRLIFNVSIKDGDLVSEDIYTCMKLKELGFPIWLDPTITCNHIGMKKYSGNFESWFDQIKNQNSNPLNNQNNGLYGSSHNRYLRNR